MSDPDYLTKQKYLAFNFGTDLAAVRQKKLGTENPGRCVQHEEP